MKSSLLVALIACSSLCGSALAQETIGPWHVKAAPISAVEVVAGGPSWSSLNVVNSSLTVQQAFTGFSLIDGGYANGQTGSVLELTFTPGMLINQPGADLVLFDTFSFSDYAVRTSYDGFVSEVSIPFAKFSDTGESRSYFYQGLGPYDAAVRAAAIELGDLGVPTGVAVDQVRLIAVSAEVDPLGLGIPCIGVCNLETYCSVNANSTGSPARLLGVGSTSVAANDLLLRAISVPDQVSLFLYGTDVTQTPFGNGFLCVGGSVSRILPATHASNHVASVQLDLPTLGIGPGNVQFQCWFRDVQAGGAGFNTSDALSVYFTP